MIWRFVYIKKMKNNINLSNNDKIILTFICLSDKVMPSERKEVIWIWRKKRKKDYGKVSLV